MSKKKRKPGKKKSAANASTTPSSNAASSAAPKKGKKFAPLSFLKEVKREVARITWPTKNETLISTGMVFVMATFLAIFFFIVDKFLAMIIKMILGIGA
ncbi:MAG: preprotein translocase subunit SecE [Alphaproteobacteria bacterium]